MLRYVRTFVVSAETSSFSAAGVRLGLTQSAVSTQIQRLEEELGYVLFDRTGKSITLSMEGKRVLPDAIRMLEIFEQMKDRRGMADTEAIELGAISTVQMSVLPRVLAHFKDKHPAVHINVIPGTSVQLLTQVDVRELDIAVIVKPRLGIPSDLAWIPLIKEYFVAVGPKGVNPSIQEFCKLPFIRYNRRSHGGQQVDQFLRKQGLWVKDAIEVDEPAIILKMVEEGLGWAIIPGTLVSPVSLLAAVSAIELPGKPFFREIGILARLQALKLRPSLDEVIKSFKTVTKDLLPD